MDALTVDEKYPTRELLKGLASLAVLVREYKDSQPKASVFNSIIGLLCDLAPFRKKLQSLEFFYPPLCMMSLKSGIVAYTMKGQQMNVHFAVPMFEEAHVTVLYEMLTKFKYPMFDEFTVNLRPLQISMPDGKLEWSIRRRRVIPHGPRLGATQSTIHSVQGCDRRDRKASNRPRDILSFVPLTRCCDDQDENTLFWTRTVCGTIVVCNPFVPIIESMGVPSLCQDLGSIYTCFPAPLHGFLRAIYPKSLDATLDSLRDETIPNYIKPVFIRTCKATFGIRDELIAQVGSLMERQGLLPCPLHIDMLHMFQFVKMSYHRNANGHSIALGVLMLVKGCDDGVSWRTWVIHSRFIYYLFDICKIDTIKQLCDGLPVFRVALSKMLISRIGEWKSKEKQAAKLLQLLPSSSVNQREEEVILKEMKRLDAATEVTLKDILRDEKAKELRLGARKRNPRKKGERAPETVSPEMSNDFSETFQKTHHATLEQLRSKWPQFCWVLVGSGIFSSESDVDVVAIVPFQQGMTLKEAYSLVQEVTRFACRGFVDGMHVCTLYSTWNGHPIDVQVTREKETPSLRISQTRHLILHDVWNQRATTSFDKT